MESSLETLCLIWYYFYNLKNVKITHGGVVLLVKLHTSKSNTPPCVPFSCPLKTPPNHRSSDIFRVYKRRTSGSNRLSGPIAYLHIKISVVAMFQTFYYKFTRNTIINWSCVSPLLQKQTFIITELHIWNNWW